jgi:predicted metalloprotease with PDZ domain
MQYVNYTLRNPHPHKKLLEIEVVFPTYGAHQLNICLPAWRPGRYELGNFSRNIQRFEPTHPAVQAENNSDKLPNLPWRKIDRNQWQIDCAGLDHVRILYNYYAAELNGGSTWVADDQVYVNPVNCFFYRPERPDERFQITLDLPQNYVTATGLKKSGELTLFADGFQELMDSPFIAAADLKVFDYVVDGVKFYIWIKGRFERDAQAMVKQFEAFTTKQIQAFGAFPVSEYHFLFQFPDHVTRHGVEHTNSTVIAMGPAEWLNSVEGYLEMLGIASHELYHTWNIKSIRPVEMMPYDFQRENYSRLGYVAEGVTTYFGDLYLLRAGLITLETYLAMLAEQIDRHVSNAGRFNLSVADSSFDTWVDGYVAGIPNRKVSIYNEGSLTAFITDLAIRKATDDARSLDDVMRLMYQRFGQAGKGYTAEDYRSIVTEVAGISLDHLFEQYIYGREDYLQAIVPALQYIGLQLKVQLGTRFSSLSGALGESTAQGYRIDAVVLDSPADRAGLALGDVVLTANGIAFDQHWLEHFTAAQQALELQVLRHRKMRLVSMNLGESCIRRHQIVVENIDNQSLNSWCWF